MVSGDDEAALLTAYSDFTAKSNRSGQGCAFVPHSAHSAQGIQERAVELFEELHDNGSEGARGARRAMAAIFIREGYTESKLTETVANGGVGLCSLSHRMYVDVKKGVVIPECKKKGRKPISQQLKSAIEESWINHKWVDDVPVWGSGRKREKRVTVKEMKKAQKKIAKDILQQLKKKREEGHFPDDKFGFTLATVNVYKPKSVRKAKRATDLCGWCEKLRRLEISERSCVACLRKDFPYIEAETSEEWSRQTACGVYRVGKLTMILDAMQPLRVHAKYAELQRECCEADIAAADTAVFMQDIKSDVSLSGRSLRGTSEEFFFNIRLTCIGMYVVLPGYEPAFYLGLSEDKIEHASPLTVFMTSKVLELVEEDYPGVLAGEKVQKFAFWNDCGSHYRSER